MLKWPLVHRGDFNAVLRDDERVGTHSNLNSLNSFNSFTMNTGVVDAGFSRNKFTWYKKRTWFLPLSGLGWIGSLSMLNEGTLFPNNRVDHLPRLNSNHVPMHMVSHYERSNYGSRLVRYMKMWSTHPEFKDFVKLKHYWLLSSPTYPVKLED